MTIFLSACNSSNNSSSEVNDPPVESNKSEENDKETPQEEYLESYSDILDNYYTALNEQWEQGALSDASLSILLLYSYEGNPLSNVGYALIDIDSNGIPKLLIGAIAGDSFVDKMVFDMYTLSDDKITLIFNGSERNRYYLCSDNSIANESSSGAADSSFSIYNLDSDGKSLKLIENEAIDKKESYENKYIQVEFIPFESWN